MKATTVKELLDYLEVNEKTYQFNILNRFVERLAINEVNMLNPTKIAAEDIILQTHTPGRNTINIYNQLSSSIDTENYFEVTYQISGDYIPDDMAVEEPPYPVIEKLKVKPISIIFSCVENTFDLTKNSKIVKLITNNINLI